MPEAPSVPSSKEMGQLVGTALAKRKAKVKPAERTTLARVGLGLLRMMIDPTGGVLGTLATSLGLPSVGDQAAQRMVDYWLDGRRDSPPFPQRPQMWPLVTKVFHQIAEPTPDAVVMDVLINVAIGILNDRFPTHHSGVKEGVSQVVARAYAMGV